MKSDEQVKEKMRSFDPLSAGIVFGREEAWEKLQGRLERSDRKIVPVSYRIAATLALLIVCGAIIYFMMNKPGTPADAPRPVMAATAVPKSAPQTVPLQEAMAVQPEVRKIAVASVVKKHAIPAKHNIPVIQQQVIAPAVPEEIVSASHNTNATVPAPVTVTKTPMKVYYIGDLERNEISQQPPPALAASPHIDLNKLKTFNINEVERQDVEFKQLLRLDNKLTLGQRFFFRPVLNYDTPPTDEYIAPRNPIKTIFNIQN